MYRFVDTIVTILDRELKGRGLPGLPEIGRGWIEQPPEPELGDYAFPCFRLAKALRKPPAVIAQELAAALQGALAAEPLLTAIESAGPYVNFRVSVEELARHTLPAILDGSSFEQSGRVRREKVMVEYSQPNTHKAFHVGHMRNVALGDALVRMMEYVGHEVIAANYIGDVGAHIAKCLWYYRNHRTEAPPAANRGEWLGEMYTAATRLLEAAPPAERKTYEAEVSRVLAQLEAREGEVYRLWEETRAWSLEAFHEIYRWLGARFDHWFYESGMELGRQIVEDGLRRGILVRSQGAAGMDLEPYGLGFFLLLKADGNTLYSTKDLALAHLKFERYGIERSIYVVGTEQNLHFQQVFKTLELLGYAQAARCQHLSYGLVMLPEGKMSSRAGNVILFSALRDRMNAYILSHYLEPHRGDWSDAEIAETCRRIAVAAIRYGMIKQDPAKNIVFNLEDWLVSEGDTGTYLCYAYTRICSVQRLVPREPDPRADFTLLTHENEKRLVRELYDFNRSVHQAAEQLRPNLVANALFRLAKEFSRTYTTSSVKNAENDAVGDARLALFAATRAVLERGLHLIGIVPPERM
ncbi:MAG: arginine--tRNA ligase [Candidatus Lambdaproteobacteria bacterium]|nr:arginine--tRNA ligase [Candidatus Lambdaproteobacteria bacterium]